MAEQLVFDYRQCDFDEADRALCDWAVKLTLTPGEMSQADVESLRTRGLSDGQIVIAAQVVSYFNYINRIADGLGVDDEETMTLGREEWQRRKGQDYLGRMPF